MSAVLNHLTNLSQRSTELQMQRILRVNATSVDGYMPQISPTPAVRGTNKFIPRVRAANEAAAQALPVWSKHGSYRTGDGETQLTRRPGSDDHLKYKSLGFGCHSTGLMK